MRKVKVFKNYMKNGDHREAVFHQWGLDGIEELDGIKYSVAIVEFPDGAVERVPPENIRFEKEEVEGPNDPLWAIVTWLERIASKL